MNPVRLLTRGMAHLLAVLALAACAQQPLPAAQVPAAAAQGFDPQPIIAERLAQFAREDAAAMPAPGGVVLVGSSIFHLWPDATRDLAPLAAINRAIGGTRTWDQVALIDQTALKYRPSVILYYCGSNDINSGATPQQIAANFAAYNQRVKRSLPRTKILFTSINRAPQKQDKWDQVDEANRLIQAYVAADRRRLAYVDVHPAIESAPRVPRLDLYLPDRLHFRRAAYAGFTAIIKPRLIELVRG